MVLASAFIKRWLRRSLSARRRTAGLSSSAPLEDSRVRLRVGGVPEHFNLPWRKAGASGAFTKRNVSIAFEEFPGGSGAMATALKAGALDAACLLTEAAVAEIAKGAPFRLVGAYVATPLAWGVHASRERWEDLSLAAAGAKTYDRSSGHYWPEDPKKKKPRFAVSRLGSGSHLMALVDATTRGVAPPTDDDLVVVGSLTGARDALREDEADLFMWEKFMTRPLVDSGEWVKLAEVPTPWPCFSVVASDALLQDVAAPRALLDALAVVRATADDLITKPRDDAAREIAAEYGLDVDDAAQWLGTVRWCARPEMPRATVDLVAQSLRDAGILRSDHACAYEDIVAPGLTQDVSELS